MLNYKYPRTNSFCSLRFSMSDVSAFHLIHVRLSPLPYHTIRPPQHQRLHRLARQEGARFKADQTTAVGGCAFRKEAHLRPALVTTTRSTLDFRYGTLARLRILTLYEYWLRHTQHACERGKAEFINLEILY